MSPRRRAALLIAAAAATGVVAAAVAATLAPAPALAAAGGGSSGFGGGGGGGGGGRGAGLYILVQLLIRLAILGHGLGLLVILAIIVAYVLVANVGPKARAARTEHAARGHASGRSTRERSRRAHLAAAEAAEDDPAFAATAIEAAAARLFADVQAAWSADDRRTLAEMIAPGLQQEWARRLDDFARRGWRNRVELDGEPTVDLVGVRRGSGTPTATVRIDARLRDVVVDRAGRRITRTGSLSDRTRVREFWTLARTGDGRWMLQSIEQGAEGAHALSDPLVATPWSDDQALHDAALLETAQTTDRPAELLGSAAAADAAAAARDLSLVDDRFSTSVLELATRRVVAAWAAAVDEGPAALTSGGLATAGAARALTGASERTRLVVRGPRLTQADVVQLDAGAAPPAVTVDAAIVARRYTEDRDTARLLDGSPTRDSRFTVRLTFALTDDVERPWQLVAAA